MKGFYFLPECILQQKQPLPLHISLEPLWPALTCQLERESSYSTDSTDTQSQVNRPGTANNVIQSFLLVKRKKHSPKLENVRSSLIRCWRKSMRAVVKRMRFSGVKKFPRDIPPSIEKEYTTLVQEHKILCEILMQPDKGPCIDSKRSNSIHKTYNNSCLKELFSQKEVRELWQGFLKVIFSNTNPNSLSERFEFKCCREGKHTQGCGTKWAGLRTVLSNYMGAQERRSR